MARNSRRTVLYEVIKKSGKKTGSGGVQLFLQKLAKKLRNKRFSDKTASEMPNETLAAMAQKLHKPQHSKRRHKLPVVMALVALALIATVFVVFKPDPTSQNNRVVEENIDKTTSLAPQKVTAQTPPALIPATSAGDHVIVIVQYRQKGDLEPVMNYFTVNGIATEIEKRGSYYFLVTKDKFQNPQKQGTDGYLAKNKIKEIGTKYKAPPGFETFGSVPFQDAYGMKLK